MSDVKRYTDYGGMIDCETQELVGGPGTYVKASDYVELRKQLEQLSDKYNMLECTADAWKIRAEKAERQLEQAEKSAKNFLATATAPKSSTPD